MKALLILAPAPIISYLVFAYSFSNELVNKTVEKHVPCCEWNFEAKITLLINMSALISLYFFALILFIGLNRFIRAAHPMGKTDPPVIKLFNQIIRNSTEQTLVFLPLLAYWTINIVTSEDKNKVVILTLIWLFGRILFCFGYSMRLLDKKLSTFRTWGFEMNLFCVIYLISRMFGYPLL